MRCYLRRRVPLISRELDIEAFLSAYCQSLHSSEQLGALAGKHWTNDQFDSSALLLLCQVLQVQLILIGSIELMK
jgi:hypothetical protein